MPVFAGAIADDDTGATDLAGMLTEQGMRVILATENSSLEELKRWSADCDAVVIGTASRSIAKNEAYARTFAAAKSLRALGAEMLAVKYCSTFDSTPAGNIGTSIDAAMDMTGEQFTVALPALPALGRTTYMGHHFVGEKLLSDSVLRHHPLNPMTNAYLPSHLQTQTTRRVGLLPYPVVAVGSDAIRARLRELQSSGVQIALIDCVDDKQLVSIGKVINDMRLITGSSAWGMVLPHIWREQGIWGPTLEAKVPTRADGGAGFLIVSGSCSEATRVQNEWAVENGMDAFPLDPIDLLQRRVPSPDMMERVGRLLRSGERCLLTTSAVAGSKQQVHAWTSEQGSSPLAAGEQIAHALAQAVAEIFERTTPQGLIVAGGETSSTLMRALRLGGLRVGPNIEPGVPVCVALARPQLGVVLKSGNFGGPDFYARAIAAVQALPTRSVEEIN